MNADSLANGPNQNHGQPEAEGYRHPSFEPSWVAEMTAAEIYADDEPIDPLAVTVSVIESSQGALEKLVGDAPEVTARRELAFELLDEVSIVTAATGWTTEDFACLLGCEHPDPDTWLNVDVDLLKQSVGVVSMMRERMQLCADRPTDHLTAYLADRLDDDKRNADLLKAARALLRLAEQRTAARESVILSIEVVSRLRGDVDAARVILDDLESAESTSRMIADDRLGSARSAILQRVKDHIAAVLKEQAFTLRTRDEAIELYGRQALENAEREIRDSQAPSPDEHLTPKQIREEVSAQTRSPSDH